MHNGIAMSLRSKIGLPIAEECLLAVAVEWLVSRKPIIPFYCLEFDSSFPMSPENLDDAIYGEAKKVLYLRSEKEKFQQMAYFGKTGQRMSRVKKPRPRFVTDGGNGTRSIGWIRHSRGLAKAESMKQRCICASRY